MSLKISIYKDLSKLSNNIIDYWRSVQWNPFSDLEYFLLKLKTSCSSISPFVFVIGNESNPEAIISACEESHPIEFQFGYKKWFGPSLKTLTIDRYSIIPYQISNEVSETLENFFQELKNF